MANPWLKFPLQFKKYPLMFGQMYYGAVVRMLGRNATPADRMEAAKQTAYLSAMTMAFAGVGGLPFIEFARVLALLALAIPGDEEKWKWDDYENAMEEWFSDMTKWALGQRSPMTAEAIMYGATRLLGHRHVIDAWATRPTSCSASRRRPTRWASRRGCST